MTGLVFLVRKKFENVLSLEPFSLSHLFVLTKAFLNVFIVFFEFQLFVNVLPRAHLAVQSYKRQHTSLP